jgi:C1A family cysteine protease
MRRYGWRKQKFEDPRDYKLAPPTSFVFPSIIDLRPLCPPLPNQGQLGSCTANAIAFALQFEMMRQNFLTPFPPSRLLIYYMEREKEGNVNEDSGAEIRDGIKVIAAKGVTGEQDWPYDVARFTEKPPEQAFRNALTFNALTQRNILYQTLNQDMNHIKGCLVSGWPSIFGFEVYESFESEEVSKTGMAPMPGHGEKMVGGHAVCVVGYDDSKQSWICSNWWGEDWGDKGYFYLPYEYLTNRSISSDFWKISLVPTV